MNKPKMILFDYGHTLLYEPGWDYLRGEEALFQYIKSNKQGLTSKQVGNFSQELYEKIKVVRDMGLELYERQFQKMLYEYLEIEFTIPLSEAEIVLWDNISAGALMPNADKILDYVNAAGIRSGVISNIGWSGAALTDRINRLLPQNRFEFILASSEYMYRKPSPMLFELALKKAGLDAADVWFCGDNIKADIEGSAAVGIFPVWYESMEAEDQILCQNEGVKPRCEHLHIHDWRELIEVLEDIQ